MNGSALRVWLVDDDSSTCWLLERALRNSGIAPRAFQSAESVLDALNSDTPEVLVTDTRLPGQSGFDLLRLGREIRPGLGGRHPSLPTRGSLQPLIGIWPSASSKAHSVRNHHSLFEINCFDRPDVVTFFAGRIGTEMQETLEARAALEFSERAVFDGR